MQERRSEYEKKVRKEKKNIYIYIDVCYVKYEIDCMIYELVDKKIKKNKVVKCRKEGLSEKKK